MAQLPRSFSLSSQMRNLIRAALFVMALSVFLLSGKTVPAFAQTYPEAARAFNVRTYGAKGDAKALDSPAINKAIDAASAAGGGTVFFPAGTYRSFSIRLKSNITLYFDQFDAAGRKSD